MSALLRAVPALLLAGCLNGDYNSNDQGVSNPPDLSPASYDLTGVDLYGLYNCSQLNACDNACQTPVCVLMCHTMATPSAKDLENNLQNCFQQYCPTMPGGVCAADSTGMLSMACLACINNTYIPKGMSCSPTQLPSECHQCVEQANACTADM